MDEINEDKNSNKIDIIDSITLIYKIKQNETRIHLFGKEFVNNNKNICTFLFEGNNYELNEFLEIPNNYNNTDQEITIKLLGINKITDINHMFSDTSFFSSPDIHK